MLKELKESSIKDFSDRVIKLAALPHGSKIHFSYTGQSGKAVKSNRKVRRQHFTARTFPCPTDKTTVTTFLDSMRGLISTNLEVAGIGMSLRGPGKVVFNGNTHLSTVRSIPGEPGPEAKKTVELFMPTLEIAGLDEDLTLLQVRSLFHELCEAVGSEFEAGLIRNAAQIRKKNQDGRA